LKELKPFLDQDEQQELRTEIRKRKQAEKVVAPKVKKEPVVKPKVEKEPVITLTKEDLALPKKAQEVIKEPPVLEGKQAITPKETKSDIVDPIKPGEKKPTN